MNFSSREEKVADLVYGRFNASNEILLHFDDRIYTDINCISCDHKIDEIQLLEDYSTLKLTFENPVQKAFVSITVKNAFGDVRGAEFSGKYYENNNDNFVLLLQISHRTVSNMKSYLLHQVGTFVFF